MSTIKDIALDMERSLLEGSNWSYAELIEAGIRKGIEIARDIALEEYNSDDHSFARSIHKMETALEGAEVKHWPELVQRKNEK